MLSLILPTFNEARNLPTLLSKLAEALQQIPHEIVVVDDDSPDGTWRVAEELGKKRYANIRVIRRVGHRGLSSAIVKGFLTAKGEVLAVMDADGQHDPKLVMRLYEAVRGGERLAVGSRYVEGGHVGAWVKGRRVISKLGTFLAKHLSRVPVSDPLSGFFAIDAHLYHSLHGRLHPMGFKILLEILAHVPRGTRIAEIPLIFQARREGKSKLSLKVHLAFFFQVLRLMMQRRR